MASLCRVGTRRVATLTRALSTTTALKSELTVEQRQKYYPKLGNRDIVGSGYNGNPVYYDKEDFPAPAIRFGENSPEVIALRQKEAGDWGKMSLEEKRTLYRASFRKTYAEMGAPTGEWKSIMACTIMCFAVTGWMMIWLKVYVYPPLPSTITDEWKIDQAKNMILQRQGPVDGVAAKFDYENNKWK